MHCAILREQNSLKIISGGYSLKVTPVPIPNTKVKLQSADGTALETVWKSRSLPGKNKTLRNFLVFFCLYVKPPV